MRRASARFFWDRMKVSLWFMPLVMALAAFSLAWLLVELDDKIPNEALNHSRLVIAGSASELRAILIGMAGTILATTGVVFSLLTLPLSTVASQFGSRLLRIFLRDRTTQLVLGIFVGTFCFCLAVALSIPYDETQAEIPQITATFGLALSLATFASLILLIHHISTMLQAPNIVAAAGAELMDVVRAGSLEKVEAGEKAGKSRETESFVDGEAYPIRISRRGYIQFVDLEIIMHLAMEKDLIIRMVRKPGQFVSVGETAALVWPVEKVDVAMGKHLQVAIQVGNQRTPTQDIEYAINQLVEVAVRAMSPAINDPFTAITCLDYLAEGMACYVRSGDASPYFFDQQDKLRLIFKPAALPELLNAAFDQLRHASCDNAYVLLQMLTAIEIIGQETQSGEARRELLRHVHQVEAESRSGKLIEMDQCRIGLRCEMLEMNLKMAGL